MGCGLEKAVEIGYSRVGVTQGRGGVGETAGGGGGAALPAAGWATAAMPHSCSSVREREGSPMVRFSVATSVSASGFGTHTAAEQP